MEEISPRGAAGLAVGLVLVHRAWAVCVAGTNIERSSSSGWSSTPTQHLANQPSGEPDVKSVPLANVERSSDSGGSGGSGGSRPPRRLGKQPSGKVDSLEGSSGPSRLQPVPSEQNAHQKATQWCLERRQKIRRLGTVSRHRRRTVDDIGRHFHTGDVLERVINGGLGRSRCISMVGDADPGSPYPNRKVGITYNAACAAVVFDCTTEATHVLSLCLDASTRQVRVSMIAECDNVTELLRQHKVRWFADFAKQTRREAVEQLATSGSPMRDVVVLVGTHAWHAQSGPNSALHDTYISKDLVSDLTTDGMICKKLDGAEQALYVAVAVTDACASCRPGFELNAIIGSGHTWVHCVRTDETTSNPVVLCNDDNSAGWQEGLMHIRKSDDPLEALETWRTGTIKQLLRENMQNRGGQSAERKVQGQVIVTSAGYYAALLVGIESSATQLRAVPAALAIDTFRACLDARCNEIKAHLAAGNGQSSSSSGAIDHSALHLEDLFMNICNLTLQIELLTTLVDAANTTLYFKREWTLPSELKLPQRSGLGSDSVAESEKCVYRPTWPSGWYMHLLHRQFNVEFPNSKALLMHLDSLNSKAVALKEDYDRKHCGGGACEEAVALKLVAVKDVVSMMRTRAATAGQQVTGLLQELSKDAGGRMHGLEHCMKTDASLFRKLISRLDKQLKAHEHIPSFVPSLASITREVDDCLRYTIILPTDRYADGVQKVINCLTDGTTGIACEGTDGLWMGSYWSKVPDCTTYMGVNTYIKLRAEHSPDGIPYTFELQFHTEESIALKDGASHELYELFRSPGITQEEKLKHYKTLKSLWNKVRVPPEVDNCVEKCGGTKRLFLDKATEVRLIFDGASSKAQLVRCVTVSSENSSGRDLNHRASKLSKSRSKSISSIDMEHERSVETA